jgi:predicted DNA-binding transcriptional regulator AlpA
LLLLPIGFSNLYTLSIFVCQHELDMEMEALTTRVYTYPEVMKIFKISRPTLDEWVEAKIFQRISVPGRRRCYITGESVERILSGNNN